MYVESFTQFRCRILMIFVNLLCLFLLLTENYISKAALNIHGKVDAPSVHKATKVTPSGVK